MFLQLTKEWQGHPAGERLEVPDEYSDLLISTGIGQKIDDPVGPMITKAMETASAKWAQSMDKVIELTLNKFQQAQSLAQKHAVPAIFGEGKEGDTKHCFGDWLMAVARGDEKYLAQHYNSAKVSYTAKAALAEASGITGGYVVPPEFSQNLLTLVAEKSIMRPRSFVQPMGSATLMIPYLDVTTAQAAGTSPFFGGVLFNWTEEAQSRTETEPQFKMLELKAHELSGYAVSSNVLLQDAAFGLEKFLMVLFSNAIAWYEDFAFIQGNGVGKPLGILNSNAGVSQTRATANKVQFADVANMIGKLLPASLSTAVWIIHPFVLPQIVQLADSSGRIVWVPNIGGAQDPIPGTLFGKPVLVSEKVPTLGSTGDTILTDPQLYVIGDRMSIEIAASEHVNFLKNQMTWRVVERIDGQPWLEKPVTLADGSSQVSSIVTLHS
jgi:HK97 family phage major capsid protein